MSKSSASDHTGKAGGLGAATKLGLIRLFFSKRTPAWARWVFGLLALAYFISPIDALPDYPAFFVGWLDDAAVGAMLIWLATKFGAGNPSKDQDASRGRKTVKNEALRPPRDGRIDERGPGMRREP